MMDWQNGIVFLQTSKIVADKYYSANSKIVVVTTRICQQEGESWLSVMQRNVNVFKFIIPHIIRCSPDCTIIVIFIPMDILTYAAWKLGGLPKHCLIGSRFNLDSARFCYLTSEKLGIHPSGCQDGLWENMATAVWLSGVE